MRLLAHVFSSLGRKLYFNHTMADWKETTETRGSIVGEDVAQGIDDKGTIPKGQIDPAYEAKARVLNRAVSPFIFSGRATTDDR